MRLSSQYMVAYNLPYTLSHGLEDLETIMICNRVENGSIKVMFTCEGQRFVRLERGWGWLRGPLL